MTILLGLEGGNHLRITVAPPLDDYWRPALLEVRAGARRGAINTEFLIGELAQLGRDLQPLYRDLTGSLHFHSLANPLDLEFTADVRGHIEIKGQARDPLSPEGQTLHFTLIIDQTQLLALIQQMEPGT